MSINIRENLIDISKRTSVIEGTDNRIITLDEIDGVPENLKNFNEKFLETILGKKRTLTEIEKKLRENYSSEDILEIDGVRLANCIAWAGTNLKRSVEKYNASKLRNSSSDNYKYVKCCRGPIGWASKVMAPSEGYGLLGKIEALRTGEDREKFNEELYNDIMNSSVDLDFKGAAIEQSENEIAFMPTIAITGGEGNIQEFSEEFEKGDISTAKHILINTEI